MGQSASSASWYIIYTILTYSLRSINVNLTTVISTQPPSNLLSHPHIHSASLISTQQPSYELNNHHYGTNTSSTEMGYRRFELDRRNLCHCAKEDDPGLVLATGPGNLQVLRFLVGGSVWFGSRPGQKPDQRCLGRVVTQTAYITVRFWPVLNWIAVPTVRFVHLWLQLSI